MNAPIAEGPSSGDPGNEIDVYIGAIIEVTENLYIDVGGTYYWFPETPQDNDIDRTRELFIGVNYDLQLNFDYPIGTSAYLYYDVDLEQTTVEVSAFTSYGLPEVCGKPVSLDLSTVLGVVDTNDTSAGQAGFDGENGYFYWSVGLDLSVELDEGISFRAGTAYTLNNDGDDGPANSFGSSQTWAYSLAVDLDF